MSPIYIKIFKPLSILVITYGRQTIISQDKVLTKVSPIFDDAVFFEVHQVHKNTPNQNNQNNLWITQMFILLLNLERLAGKSKFLSKSNVYYFQESNIQL